jgi:methyl-accepting chemotaxis protein
MIRYFVKDAPIARKMQIGFGALLLAAAAAAGWMSLSSQQVAGLATDYRQTARVNNFVATAVEDFTEARVYAKRLVITGEAQYRDTALSNMDDSAAAVRDAADINHPDVDDRAIDAILSDLGSYRRLIEGATSNPNAANDLYMAAEGVGAELDALQDALIARQDGLGPQMSALLEQSTQASLAIALLILVGGFGVVMLLAGMIATPMARMTGLLERLAKGETDFEVPYADHKDDAGRLSTALGAFKGNLEEMRRMEAAQIEAKRRAEEDKRAAMNRLADQFQSSVLSVVDAVAAAAEELEASAQSLNRTAADTSAQSGAVARSAEDSATNIQRVASASEEMSVSAREIASQASQAKSVSQAAQIRAQETYATVRDLRETAGRINEVVRLISDIAAQTNLLALNATIEAARAGDAGRGFAVVASEVKTLAEQTAKATETISTQIQQVQNATDGAAEAVEAVARIISEITEISVAVASAVEQQTAVVGEISRTASDVSQGTSEVTSAIGLVRQGASETGSAAQQSLAAARELAGQAARLRNDVAGFIDQVRAA